MVLRPYVVAVVTQIGALFASKSHGHHQEWSPSPHQKEIHLHIHNQHGHENHEEHVPITSWNREGYAAQALNYIYNPYKAQAGPQTISTPFGNYVKIDAT
ncbi:uncharacterized protein LOC113239065 [Hyposmocoma kahamanoa]|uniref:uncharacterized protein LOC113239065 n=1 Tax=Hyposmocoma kahamanoa TaxID=1477025 RepID=UPI000E6D62CF|nr:uncharacterized protein LOC113239065 [Hyposmocoma kahamanoa]